ncbi:5-formyltetrahydrofolate cyclo-ligase [Peribacillus acanthi]|uniref:5-formyltetrahydrofolate cyclo-ligase n=1 Tax=Peribacillus acanthi TaxID=2171554 RepID=UPI001F0BDAF8|nr:5-formyltetrahydrofolate cyclo-ligase [Peribacillus acanthi]
METKSYIRKQILNALTMKHENDYKEQSCRISEKLFLLKEWNQSKIVAITVSNFPEVETRTIIESAWEQGKIIVVPKCIPKEKKMDFRKIDSFDQLEQAYFSLWEPIVHTTESIQHDKINLTIVPGVAFARNGYRIGFGGGYYDRYLENWKGMTVSLAFEEQIVNSVPIDRFDLPVSTIITPKEVIYCDI